MMEKLFWNIASARFPAGVEAYYVLEVRTVGPFKPPVDPFPSPEMPAPALA